MSIIIKALKNPNIILIFILLLGLFFRIYKLEVFYPWGHDQDLFAWIAKDMIVDHHFRLIGQETSITGLFIGPLFYYLIAISFAVFNMNPLSAYIVTTIVSLLTITSIYWVFKKFFGVKVGLVGAFLYAVSPGTVFLDRWIVPTQPTILWAIWYFYVLLSILNGYNNLILLGVLLGLIWHVHIAFLPLLLLLLLAFILSGKKENFKFNRKSVLISVLLFFILILPFLAFEVRHGFGQTKALIYATYQDRGDLTGFKRLEKVVDSGGRSMIGAFVLSNTAIGLDIKITSLIVLLLPFLIYFLGKKQFFTKSQSTIFLAWYLIVFYGQFFSKRPITEYYFNNFFVILFLLVSIFLIYINNHFRKLHFALVVMGIYLLIVSFWIMNKKDDLGGYLYRKQAIDYIKTNSMINKYHCIAINFIEEKNTSANGFRYLFWFDGLKLISPGNDVPIFNIVYPWTISANEIDAKFGNFGVILPSQKNLDVSVCSKEARQLLPLWGFVN